MVSKITAIQQGSRSVLLAVDGPAGAGKSECAIYLAEVLPGSVIVPMDDFLAWDDLTDYWQRFEEQVLEPFLSGRPIRYQVRDWENDPMGRALADWKRIAPSSFVILEGIGSSRRRISVHLSCAIWVDAPAEVRLERGVLRDGEAMRSRWTDWQLMESRFFAEDRTRSRAHLLVDGVTGRFVKGPNCAMKR